VSEPAALILSLGPADAPRLAALHAEAFDAAWDAAAFETLLGQPGVFAIGNVDGFILCRIVVDEAEVLTLAVRPAARRGGQGRRLTETAAGLAAQGGAETLFLEVAEDNPAAIALYLSAGFTATGRRRGYYARPDGGRSDARLFSLKLNGRLPTT